MQQQTLLILIAIITLPIFAQAQFNKYPIPYRKGDKWGYCDEDKNIIVEPIYDEVKLYERGYPVSFGEVKQKNKIGIVDEKGKLIVPVKFDKIERIYYESEKLLTPVHDMDLTPFVIVQKGKKYGFYNTKTGKSTKTKLSKITYTQLTEWKEFLFIGEKGSKQYKIDLETAALIPVTEEEITVLLKDKSDIEEEFLIGMHAEEEILTPLELYHLDKVIPYAFDSISTAMIGSEHYAYHLIYKDGLVGAIEYKYLSKMINDIKYRNEFSSRPHIRPMYDEIVRMLYSSKKDRYKYFVVKKDGKYSVASTYTKVPLAPIIYDRIDDDGYHKVKTIYQDKCGYIILGKKTYVVEAKYDSVSYIFEEDYELLKVVKDGKNGYVNYEGVEYFED
jgi:hypothetical protein